MFTFRLFISYAITLFNSCLFQTQPLWSSQRSGVKSLFLITGSNSFLVRLHFFFSSRLLNTWSSIYYVFQFGSFNLISLSKTVLSTYLGTEGPQRWLVLLPSVGEEIFSFTLLQIKLTKDRLVREKTDFIYISVYQKLEKNVTQGGVQNLGIIYHLNSRRGGG